MKISAIQKTTLLDYPDKLACTVFLSGCNLRCPFCHNADLVSPEKIQPPSILPEEFFSFLADRRGILEGVCISGGEPTLYADLPELLRRIRAMGFSVKLDTNGSNPRMLSTLIQEGLVDYVAMDIKNCPSHYTQTCGGIDILDAVQESAALLMQGHTDYEFRTTVCHPLHTPERMQQIGHWLRGAEHYFLQPFVDSGNLVGQGISSLTKEQLHALHQAVLADIPKAKIRGL